MKESLPLALVLPLVETLPGKPPPELKPPPVSSCLKLSLPLAVTALAPLETAPGVVSPLVADHAPEGRVGSVCLSRRSATLPSQWKAQNAVQS
ncbi:MAG TPA: hypothetical protein VMV69_27995 [Pirellulales bacterium]|nr:hypothetical protein [Pirellulales bacterium]